MVIGATIALLANDVLFALTNSVVAVAFFHATFIAQASLTVFASNGVPEVTRSAQVASFAIGVVQAVKTFSVCGVARAEFVGVDVSGAFADFAEVADDLGLTEKSGCAGFASSSVVTFQAVTAYFRAVIADLEISLRKKRLKKHY